MGNLGRLVGPFALVGEDDSEDGSFSSRRLFAVEFSGMLRIPTRRGTKPAETATLRNSSDSSWFISSNSLQEAAMEETDDPWLKVKIFLKCSETSKYLAFLESIMIV